MPDSGNKLKNVHDSLRVVQELTDEPIHGCRHKDGQIKVWGGFEQNVSIKHMRGSLFEITGEGISEEVDGTKDAVVRVVKYFRLDTE